MTAATTVRSSSGQPSRQRRDSTTTVPATVATITTPSLTLIELQPVQRPHAGASSA